MSSLDQILFGDMSAANQSPTKGWIAGHMQQRIAHTNQFEVKLWEYTSPMDYGKKRFDGVEIITIFAGVITIIFYDADSKKERLITLRGSTRDYCIVPPHLEKTVTVQTYPAHGVTIRSPSFPGVSSVLPVAS